MFLIKTSHAFITKNWVFPKKTSRMRSWNRHYASMLSFTCRNYSAHSNSDPIPIHPSVIILSEFGLLTQVVPSPIPLWEFRLKVQIFDLHNLSDHWQKIWKAGKRVCHRIRIYIAENVLSPGGWRKGVEERTWKNMFKAKKRQHAF